MARHGLLLLSLGLACCANDPDDAIPDSRSLPDTGVPARRDAGSEARDGGANRGDGPISDGASSPDITGPYDSRPADQLADAPRTADAGRADGFVDATIPTPEQDGAKEDLCVFSRSGRTLHCALSQGGGAFSRIYPGHVWSDLSEAKDVLVADVDGDGWADTCASSPGTPSLRCRTSTGAGGFRTSTFSTSWTGSLQGAEQLVALDRDGDGRSDFCAASSAKTAIGCVRAREDGTLGVDGAPIVWSALAAGATLLALELSGDEREDVCVFSKAGALACALSQSSGELLLAPASPSWTDLEHADGVVPADVNGDGRTDLCAYQKSKTSLRCAVAQGDGRFVPAPTSGSWSALASSDGVLVIDLDGDDADDLCSYSRSQVAVACTLSQRDATFKPLGTTFAWDPLKQSEGVLALDMTGDGKDDLCSYSRTTAQFHCATSKGDGTFSAVYPGVSWSALQTADGVLSGQFGGAPPAP